MRTIALFLLLSTALGSAPSPAPTNNLVGIWEASRYFGPRLRGSLMLGRNRGQWIAEIAGQRTNATIQGTEIDATFGSNGAFHGVLNAKTNEIHGHWTQPATFNAQMRFASPVTLKYDGKNRWRGEVVPLEDEFTCYLVASAGEDGRVNAFLQNPDRNLGVFLNVAHVECENDTVKLTGHIRGENDDTEEKVLAQGQYHAGTDPGQDQLSIFFPTLNATFDFSRANDTSFFYARGRNPSE
jgi:hypothetical protein